jgi:hypothetical protein
MIPIIALRVCFWLRFSKAVAALALPAAEEPYSLVNHGRIEMSAGRQTKRIAVSAGIQFALAAALMAV